MMVWLGFLGAAVCTKREEHLKMGFSIARWVNPQFDKLVLFFLNIAFMVFLIFLIKAGFTVCNRGAFMRSPALQIPLIYIMSVIPFSGIAMFIFHIVSLYRIYKGENQ